MNYSWTLLPRSSAKKLPEYIPRAIVEDYEEACAIVDLSPKSSATLSRRCLQTIIRDFWGIKNKSRLIDEVEALDTSKDVSVDVKEAFHSIRSIGNIGAHMEMDVNQIINIEPEEAKVLVQFIENLIALTYIERHNHSELLGKIKQIASSKKDEKK